MALLFPLGALAVVRDGRSPVVHRGATTVDRLGPRTLPVVSIRTSRARMSPGRFAIAWLAAGVVLIGVALGDAVGRRNRGASRAAGRSRAPPGLRFG